ncbi:bifunctional adenosylcobinamide kinase/adenosylcobinamide-phosphate guanylyltransferase [Cohnella rhizosphaerae]|uniref:Bifunctional adenosylcobinamide kinase/adenosylcobinamide-phosphate guanylyltransferase n=1 Tax=Cohnella rhizosphaerae TaxID=1457232 RepID=A0A9X4KPL1_9BACL|nr:bifunctional adenosylcobinamide kinase/adenosylcobinamide-phosphate guanylyltransferase [Cohnella rhizosphaerae]MDG0808744.1 bifunctional adenosylcobinamide kinase/adenosylcobinamide-phosphate guanylyltransferase [Cohnella rhizosphaerae]
MLLLVTGGTGSGKSAYARRLAESLGREAIGFTCPAWPSPGACPTEDAVAASGATASGTLADAKQAAGRRGFAWTQLPADDACAQALIRVNLDSNPYRAERRALVLDSLSGWLRHRVLQIDPREGNEGQAAAATGELLGALLEFEGVVIVVTEEAAAGLVPDPRERTYMRLLAESNRRLAAASHTIYRLSFGIAEAIRGERI